MNEQNWNQQNESAPAPVSTGKGLCIAGLVLGIVSLVFVWAWWFIALPTSIVGLVLSVVGRKKAKLAGAPVGLGTAGLVLSIIGLSVAVIVFFYAVLIVGVFLAAVAA